MTYTITENKQYNSIEINFNEKPNETIRNNLKELRFRWHNVKKVWYGYASKEDILRAIETNETNDQHEQKQSVQHETEKKTKKNYFGVKVGDLFHASWGYEQTNNNFFQVIELVGEKSVRVVEVNPPMMKEEAVCSMASDRTFKTKNVGLLPPVERSVFINDCEKGDLKRLKSYSKDGKSNPQFILSSFANAYYCGSDTMKVYESWYY